MKCLKEMTEEQIDYSDDPERDEPFLRKRSFGKVQKNR